MREHSIEGPQLTDFHRRLARILIAVFARSALADATATPVGAHSVGRRRGERALALGW
jgi:hypothetical protein